jgi:putative oxidoreductase
MLMRLAAGITLINQGAEGMRDAAQLALAAPHAVAICAGIFLLAGLWTPVAGVVVAVINLWNTFAQNGDPWIHILLGTVGIALALVGPGAWSIDARLFGWKRIEISRLAE